MLVFHYGFWDAGQAAGVLELLNEAGNSTIDRPRNTPPGNVGAHARPVQRHKVW
jgi:hypothetical protein